MAELEDVAAAARDLLQSLRGVNELPQGFPKPQVEEIADALIALPQGTAEGAREPLRYAHERLGEIRRVYMARAGGDDLAPFARGGFVDLRVGGLYLAIGTARHQLAATAEEEFDEEVLPPVMGPPPEDPLVETALEAAAELERSAADSRRTLLDLAEPESKLADDAARQFRDVETTAELARAEYGLADRNQAWRKRFAAAIRMAPRLISRSLRALRRGVDIAERCWDAWDEFQRKGVAATFELARKLVDIASEEFEKVSPTGPPDDFDLEEARRMILDGQEPKASWRPWIFALNFGGERLADLAPIARLENLEVLSLAHTQVSDIAPIARLQNLQELSLTNTQVSDIAPIARLQNLQSLSLTNTQVSDIAPITRLENLQSLSLVNTQVSDIAPVARLEKLQWLSLDNTQVSDMAPVSRLEKLHSLLLVNTQISDIAPVAKLEKLEVLSLAHTRVSDIAQVARLQNLQSLSLAHTQVSDIAQVARLENLQVLSLDYTHVSDIAPVARLEKLQFLSFENTHVSDIAPVATLENLRCLSLRSTSVRDLAPLSHLPKLERVIVESEERRAILAPTIGERADEFLFVEPILN